MTSNETRVSFLTYLQGWQPKNEPKNEGFLTLIMVYDLNGTAICLRAMLCKVAWRVCSKGHKPLPEVLWQRLFVNCLTKGI